MKILALLLPLAALGAAQTRLEFEVASIRPAVDDGDHDIDNDKGFYKIHNLTLKRLVAQAWEIDEAAISGGPNWLASDTWDITAGIPREPAEQTVDQLRQMLQSLLTDRFHLAIHREPRQMSGYALVIAKRGQRMETAKPDAKGSETHGSDSYLMATNISMDGFAKRLSRNRDVGKVVVDRTGLKGGFNFELDWTPEKPEGARDAPLDEHPSIFGAIEAQLGLKLESAKVTIQAIVVDRAEKPAFDQ